MSKRPSFLSLISLCKRCVLSILEISHTNQIVLVLIYPDATDKLDSSLNISRWYFGKNNFFGFELFYPFFQISSLSYSKIDSMKKNQILPSSRFNFGINPTLHKEGSHNDPPPWGIFALEPSRLIWGTPNSGKIYIWCWEFMPWSFVT